MSKRGGAVTFDLATGGDAFRVYEPDECGPDGYPLAWHDLGDGLGVKHLVREQAGHRCVRCHHPFVCGETPAEWSPCDEHCTHRGPARYRPGWSELGEGIGDATDIDPWADVTATPAEATAGQLVDGGIDVEARWRILTVHHLRIGDDAKRDLRWFNLAALCQRCHLSVQTRVVMERVWPWPHSEWFKPFAAAWYALTYLGEELSREEVVGRLDELLALELMASEEETT